MYKYHAFISYSWNCWFIASLHLFSGGSVFTSPGFNALKFFSWLKTFSPTWYSAVPTMHQVILSRANRNSEIIAKAKIKIH